MEPDFIKQIAALAQYPMLGFFTWWIWQSNKRQDELLKTQNDRWDRLMEKQNARWDDNNNAWRAYLAERNSKLETSLEKLSDALRNKR